MGSTPASVVFRPDCQKEPSADRGSPLLVPPPGEPDGGGSRPTRLRASRYGGVNKKTPRSFPSAGFEFLSVVRLVHAVLTPYSGRASPARLVKCTRYASGSSTPATGDRRTDSVRLPGFCQGRAHLSEFGVLNITEVLLLTRCLYD
jgi:hypothetical protein